MARTIGSFEKFLRSKNNIKELVDDLLEYRSGHNRVELYIRDGSLILEFSGGFDHPTMNDLFGQKVNENRYGRKRCGYFWETPRNLELNLDILGIGGDDRKAYEEYFRVRDEKLLISDKLKSQVRDFRKNNPTYISLEHSYDTLFNEWRTKEEEMKRFYEKELSSFVVQQQKLSDDYSHTLFCLFNMEEKYKELYTHTNTIYDSFGAAPNEPSGARIKLKEVKYGQ